MIGAVEFMKKWHDFCQKRESCDHCKLRDACRGSMSVIHEQDILTILALVMGGDDVETKEFIYPPYWS